MHSKNKPLRDFVLNDERSFQDASACLCQILNLPLPRGGISIKVFALVSAIGNK